MKKKFVSLLLAACLLVVALPLAASADENSISFNHTSYETIVRDAKEGVEDSTQGAFRNNGFLYDIDGNGIQELILSYCYPTNMYGNWFCCVYTKINGRVKPILENEGIASPGFFKNDGRFGIMSYNGHTYFGIDRQVGDKVGSGSNIRLYAYKNGTLSLSKRFEPYWHGVENTYSITEYAGPNFDNGTERKVSKAEYEAALNSVKYVALAEQKNEYLQDSYAVGKDYDTLLAEVKAYEASNVAGFDDVHQENYFAKPVQWAVENNITSGTGTAAFSPNQPCTRAQAVTFLWRAAGQPEPQSTSNDFIDVKPGAYYEKAVQWAVENNITGGTGNNTFSPDSVCTRAQIVTFLYHAASSPAISGNSSFNDVKAGSYYENAVKWAVENGITSGTGGNSFSPNNNCVRGQIVTFLYNYYN